MADRRKILEEVDLSGHTVIITGSTGGLGSELAEQYLRAGTNLFLIGKDQKKLDRQVSYLNTLKKGNQFIELIVIDFSSEDYESLLEDKIKELPDIDTLVNNAAVHGPIGQFWQNNLEEWENNH